VDAAAAVEALGGLRAEVQELNKYVALNYVAVVKCIKKRNRHLQVCVRVCACRW
jgi:SPX domain protein involved in polyphosphate accumulation